MLIQLKIFKKKIKKDDEIKKSYNIIKTINIKKVTKKNEDIPNKKEDPIFLKYEDKKRLYKKVLLGNEKENINNNDNRNCPPIKNDEAHKKMKNYSICLARTNGNISNSSGKFLENNNSLNVLKKQKSRITENAKNSRKTIKID